jgi:hypothetical protein
VKRKRPPFALRLRRRMRRRQTGADVETARQRVRR